jgi:hypothetical protein
MGQHHGRKMFEHHLQPTPSSQRVLDQVASHREPYNADLEERHRV